MATTSNRAEDPFQPVADLADIEREAPMVATVDGQAVGFFLDDGELRVLDNRCPHMGFPLHEGTVEDGILTCHWHHARFELSGGDTFDLWADDVPTYPYEIRDGTVYVDPTPQRDETPREHWVTRLETGMEENIGLVIAKAVIGLADIDEPETTPLRFGTEFGAKYREGGWTSGHTILSTMGNLLPHLQAVDRQRAMVTGLQSVAGDCSGEPPRFELEPFDSNPGPTRLRRWFRDAIEVRDGDGAERILRTAVHAAETEDSEVTLADVQAMLVLAACDHRYMASGHTMDFINKAFEVLDRVGWDIAEDVLPTLIPQITGGQRSEELSSWRKPDDLPALLAPAFEAIPDTIPTATWEEPADFTDVLLSADPAAIVEALSEAIEDGATVADLASAVSNAAAIRVAQFSTGNEFSDWNTVHHTFTYANAVEQLAYRLDEPLLYRAVYDGALSVYLDRFLNVPPASIPEVGEAHLEIAPEDVHEELLETFDREGTVNRAGRLVAGYLDDGGDPTHLIETLGKGLLREDAGFHSLQNLEAAVARYDRAETPERERIPLIATARYLAAHFPTRREREQTFTIAKRLNRGERIHERDDDDA